MFDNLVESTSHRPEAKRNATFIAVTFAIWTLVFLGALVAGVLYFNAQLDEQLSKIEIDVSFSGGAPPPVASGPKPKVQPKAVPVVAPVFAAPKEAPKVIDTTPSPPKQIVAYDPNATGPAGPSGPAGPATGLGGGFGDGEGFGEGDGGTPRPAPPPPRPPDPPPTPSVVRRSEGVIRGNASSRITPDYPPLARSARVAGDVVVEITISEDGDVIAARCVSGHALLQQSALSAARRWKFKPTLLNNTPVKVTGILTFRYTL